METWLVLDFIRARACNFVLPRVHTIATSSSRLLIDDIVLSCWYSTAYRAEDIRRIRIRIILFCQHTESAVCLCLNAHYLFVGVGSFLLPRSFSVGMLPVLAGHI